MLFRNQACADTQVMNHLRYRLLRRSRRHSVLDDKARKLLSAKD